MFYANKPFVLYCIERVHYQFCKKVLGVRKTTQNDFVYGELGRITFITRRYFDIVKYWFKVLATPDHKYVKIILQFNVA